jgi:hypothetical protein
MIHRILLAAAFLFCSGSAHAVKPVVFTDQNKLFYDFIYPYCAHEKHIDLKAQGPSGVTRLTMTQERSLLPCIMGFGGLIRAEREAIDVPMARKFLRACAKENGVKLPARYSMLSAGNLDQDTRNKLRFCYGDRVEEATKECLAKQGISDVNAEEKDRVKLGEAMNVYGKASQACRTKLLRKTKEQPLIEIDPALFTWKVPPLKNCASEAECKESRAAAGVSWTLQARKDGFEAWKDGATGIIWSDELFTELATPNLRDVKHDEICDTAGKGPSAGLTGFILPRLADYLEAEKDGIRIVFNMRGRRYFTAKEDWLKAFDGTHGTELTISTNMSGNARCIRR